MSADLPPVTDRAAIATKAVNYAAKRGWIPEWLADMLRGALGGAGLFAVLALAGPLGNKPEPAPTVAPPTAGKFYTEAEIETMQSSYKKAGYIDAVITIAEAIDPVRVEESRGIIKNLLEDASK